MNDKKQTNTKLAKTLAAIFKSTLFPQEVQENAIEAFNENLYSLLQQSLDISITNEKITEYQSVDQNDPVAQVRFITSVLENDMTYTVLNYYMAQTIKAYIQTGNDQQKKEIASILQREGLIGDELDDIENSYQTAISS
jgi:hypothetical protein